MRTESDYVAYHAVDKLPGRSVLVLAPHADDEVFGCGGTLVKHRRAGDSVSVVIVTDGSFGQPEDVRAAHAAMRAGESLAASRLIGYSAPDSLHYRDRELAGCDGLVLHLLKIFNESDFDLICVPSIDEMHPDHHALVLAALRAAALGVKDVSVAMYEVGRPLSRVTHLVDVSDVYEVKLDAMRCFPSQLSHQSYDQHIVALNTFRTYTLSKEVLYAEAFWVVNQGDIPDLIRAASMQPQRPTDGASSGMAERALPADVLNCAELLQQQIQHNTQLDEQVASLNAEVDRLYNSNTWRLTAPLRALRRVVTSSLQRLSGR